MPKCPSLVQMMALTNSMYMQNINILGNVVISITIGSCTRTLTTKRFDSQIIAYFIALSMVGVSLGQTWLRVYVVMHIYFNGLCAAGVNRFNNIFTSFYARQPYVTRA